MGTGKQRLPSIKDEDIQVDGYKLYTGVCDYIKSYMVDNKIKKYTIIPA